MRDHRMGRAPDFTNAALFMGFVNLAWVFAVIWALCGMGAVLALAYGLHLGIVRLGRR